MREAAFNGGPEAYLSYTYLSLVAPSNLPPEQVGGDSATGARTISFSFVAQQGDGVLLAMLHEVSPH